MSEISGGERSLLNLWENLDRDKFKPYLIVPGQGELSEKAKKTGLEIFFLTVPQIRLKNLFSILDVMFKLSNYIRKYNIKIIHSYAPRNNILSAILGKLWGTPVIWHERNLIYESEGNKEFDRSRQLMSLPNRIICNSQAVAERFHVNGEVSKKVNVILNGVNLERFNPDLNTENLRRVLNPGDQKVVGIVSNLNKRKRVEYFIKVASYVLKKIDNVQFIVLGGEFPDCGGKRLEELKKMANELGLRDHIIFTGFRHDVASVLNIFDIFLHTTLKEACSRAILEAMAAAKPVIAIDDGGNPELIENGVTGILKNPEDVRGLVEAVIELLRDESKCIEMGQNGRKRVEKNFNIKRNVQMTQKIYSDLVHLQ